MVEVPTKLTRQAEGTAPGVRAAEWRAFRADHDRFFRQSKRDLRREGEKIEARQSRVWSVHHPEQPMIAYPVHRSRYRPHRPFRGPLVRHDVSARVSPRPTCSYGYQTAKRKLSFPRDFLDSFYTFLILGLILGARLGYVLFYNLSFYIDASARCVRRLAGRHVLSRRSHRERSRRHLVLPPLQGRSLAYGGPGGGYSADRAGPGQARAISSTASCTAG